MTDPARPDSHRARARFRAVLTPHRSLGRVGFLAVMALVCGVSFTAGVAFMLEGAWPVFGFLGLDVALVYLALRMSYRAGRAWESVELTDSRLIVRRRLASGRVEAWEFEPYWLQVQIDDPPEPASPLTIRSHGRVLAIGRFLSPGERLEFARALRRELASLRLAPGAEI